MVEVHEKTTKGIKQYRVEIHGIPLKNKKGEIRLYPTVLEALSAAQRVITKEARQK